jgi:hypothetical protein
MKTPSSIGLPVAALLGTALLLISGCQATSGSTGLIQGVEEAKLSESQLRMLLNDFVRRFIDQVDAATAVVLDRETDPEIRRRALLFRMNTASACAVAAADNDPVAALVDVWALSVQMRQYYESPTAAAQMKAHREFVIGICRTLQEQTEEIARDLTSSEAVEEFTVGLEAWARENPVESPFYGRPSMVPHYSKQKNEIRQGLFDVLPGLEQRLADVSSRVALYAALLPRQLRWEAEFLMSVVATPDEYREAIQSVKLINASLSNVANTVTEAETILERQRDAVIALAREEADRMLEAVETMRTDTHDRITEARREAFADLDRQRNETLETLKSEREIVLAAIVAQRTAAFADLAREREIVLQSADDLRVATLEGVREIAEQSIGIGAAEARALMDRGLRRGVVYGVCFVGFLFAAGFAFVWLVRKTRGVSSIALASS